MPTTHTTRLMAALVLPVGLLFAGCDAGYEEDSGYGERDEYGAVEDEVPDGPSREGDRAVRTEQRTVTFADWDADANAVLDQPEFERWWEEEGFFGEWDEDSNDQISEDEFAVALHDRWDADDDDLISEREWEDRTVVWFGDTDYGIWADWDLDGDGGLDEDEIREDLAREGLYDTVDVDDDYAIDDEELSDWLFDTFDINDDYELDITEWDELGT